VIIPVRYFQYGFGQHRIFYVTAEGEDVHPPPPEVHCYFPDTQNKEQKLIMELKHLDTGVYYFDIFFRLIGNHLFIFFEGEEKIKTGILNAIIKDRMI